MRTEDERRYLGWVQYINGQMKYDLRMIIKSFIRQLSANIFEHAQNFPLASTNIPNWRPNIKYSWRIQTNDLRILTNKTEHHRIEHPLSSVIIRLSVWLCFGPKMLPISPKFYRIGYRINFSTIRLYSLYSVVFANECDCTINSKRLKMACAYSKAHLKSKAEKGVLWVKSSFGSGERYLVPLLTTLV